MIKHIAVILRDAAGAVIEAHDIDPDHGITNRELRDLIRRAGAAGGEIVTTIERHPS